jgi:hypothetical protein
VNQEGLTLPRVLKVASLGAGKSIERCHRRNRHRINDGAAFTTRVTDTGCSSGMRADAERNLDVVNLHKAKSKIRVVAEHPAEPLASPCTSLVKRCDPPKVWTVPWIGSLLIFPALCSTRHSC